MARKPKKQGQLKSPPPPKPTVRTHDPTVATATSPVSGGAKETSGVLQARPPNKAARARSSPRNLSTEEDVDCTIDEFLAQVDDEDSASTAPLAEALKSTRKPKRASEPVDVTPQKGKNMKKTRAIVKKNDTSARAMEDTVVPEDVVSDSDLDEDEEERSTEVIEVLGNATDEEVKDNEENDDGNDAMDDDYDPDDNAEEEKDEGDEPRYNLRRLSPSNSTFGIVEEDGDDDNDEDFMECDDPLDDRDAHDLTTTYLAISQKELTGLRRDQNQEPVGVPGDHPVPVLQAAVAAPRSALRVSHRFLSGSHSSGSTAAPPVARASVTMADPVNGVPRSYLQAATLNVAPTNLNPSFADPETTERVRYKITIPVKSTAKPIKEISSAIKALYKEIQAAAGNGVKLAAWDSDKYPHLFKLTDMPTGDGKDTAKLTEIFGKYPMVSLNKDFIFWAQIHLISKKPQLLSIPLREIGLLSDSLQAATNGVSISKNPHHMPCPDHKPLGYFQYSTRTMDSGDLLRDIYKLLQIPKEVTLGLQWRRIKDDNGRMYPWGDDDKARKDNPAPQALHLDVNPEAEYVMMGLFSQHFKKRAKPRPLGYRLRFVPCFSSHKGPALRVAAPAEGQTETPRATMLVMHQKQRFFNNVHIANLECNYIVDLSATATDKNGSVFSTREYIMMQHPPDSVTDRIFVSVSKKYNSDTYVLTTVATHAALAANFLASMIPQSRAIFGPASDRWWTAAGRLAHANVCWDDKRGLTMQDDFDVAEANEDDPFEMNKAWKTSQATLTASSLNQAAAIPAVPHEAGTVSEMMMRRSQDDDQSLGVYTGRPHDGDTVVTEKAPAEAPVDNSRVTFSPVPTEIAAPTLQAPAPAPDDHSVSTIGTSGTAMSVGTGATTNSTRKNLKTEKNNNVKLRAENNRLVQEADEAARDAQEAAIAALQAQAMAERLRQRMIALGLDPDEDIPAAPNPPTASDGASTPPGVAGTSHE